jgi:hypothetical protein
MSIKIFMEEFERLLTKKPSIMKEDHLFINLLRSKLGLNPIDYNGFAKEKRRKTK